MATRSKTIPTNTSSRDHATSMFTRLAISVNCDHNWLTYSYGPPNCRTSIKDDTFATTGNVASRAPDLSTIKSSTKGDSQSRTARRPRRMCSFRRSSSISLCFPQNLKHATQEFPASIAGYGQNASPPDGVARSHEGHASIPRYPFDKPDNRNNSVCQLHR